MKNLSLWHISTKTYSIESEEGFCASYGHHEDSPAGELFVCSNKLIVTSFDHTGAIKWTKDLTKFVSSENAPVNITFLQLTNCVSVGLANGELMTISDLGSNCDLAGVCDNGLLAMAWSPDQELLALITKDFSLVLMSCTFDPINESSLLSDEFGEKQFITVGWGKKETQFHGSEGKQAAKINTEVVADKDEELNNNITITWRGDGNLFAVGFLMEGIRRFKVFDRDGNLQYTSEKQLGLEANLSWRPRGNLIATTQKLSDKYIVAFFEKNGLKHGEFTIPIDLTNVVENLFWSFDSEILTLLCKDTATNIQKVLLFTSSNYHWYLKQTLVFTEQQRIGKIMWDNSFEIANNKKMHIVLQNGNYYAYTWIWNTDHSKGKSDCDDASVAVIDGNKLLISAFRYTTVPPPMSNTEVEIDSNIESIHFVAENSCINSNSLMVKTNKKLVFLEQCLRNPLTYTVYKTISLDQVSFPFQCYNWFWLNNEIILCILAENDSSYQLIQYKVSGTSIEQQCVKPLPSAVTRMQCHPSLKSVVFLQLEIGDILEYNSDGTITPHIYSFSTACPIFYVLSVENDIYFLGLSHNGCLYVNDKLIMHNISSIFVHSSYLLLTTLKHILLCTELTKTGLNCIELYDKSETPHVYKRKIERGAKLVVAVPKETRTVLQMPRGNIETIEPRPLSLKIIGEYLDLCKYYEAFVLMRKQRINLNLIYDHNPKLFTESIEIFFACIHNNSWLNLFLSDLQNIDVTKTMYRSSYPDKKISADNVQHEKIQHVCDIVIAHLNKASDCAFRILPLLTAFVKKNKLEEALAIIKNLKNEELSTTNLPVSSEEALKYLLYMVNVDCLFDIALGMYDFNLVLLVANKSQKDPKEYVAMLNELNEMDENYKQFTINKHLKRFDKAVQCLAKCGPNRYGELKTFVKYHSLYREALALFTVNDDIFKEMSDDFGLYLKLKKHYIEAGIIYERAKSIDKAIECYKDALEWELVLRLAQDKSKEELKELCWDLAVSLKEEKRHKEAIQVLEQYDNDNEDIINFAIDCGQFKTALRFCMKFKSEHLVEKNLLPSLLKEYTDTRDLIETNWKNFVMYRNRLQVVKELKSKQPVVSYDTYCNKDADLYSDAGSTIASSGSGRSYRSSKNKRKHERKVASLKEGSQYEDIALVMALHTVVTSTYDLRQHVKEINIVLSCLDRDPQALTLQTSLETTLKEMKDSFKEIWSNEFTLEATKAAIAAESVPEGSAVIPQGLATLESHLRITPALQDLQWKLEGLNL